MNTLETVLGNTAMRVFFSASDARGADHIIRTSGNKLTVLESRGTAQLTSTSTGSFPERYSFQEGQAEVVTPRFDGNTINKLNSDAGLCIVEVSPMSGFTRIRHPVFVRTMFMTTEEEFRRRSATPWPAKTEGMILGPPPPPPQPPEQPRPAPPPEPPPPVAPRRKPNSDKIRAQEELAGYLRSLAFPDQK